MRQTAVCFLVKENKVLLLKVNYPDGKEIWNGVGGWIEEGESPEQGIIREIREEIGVEVKEDDLQKGYELKGETPFTAYTVSKWQGGAVIKEDSIKQIKWFNFNEIPYEQMFEGNRDWLSQILVTTVI